MPLQTNISVNQAVQSATMDRDRAKKTVGHTDKYTVKVIDDKGREYVIEYL